MTKIIWMSDPHFQHEGTIDGLNPRLRLASAIEHANTHHPDADFAILSGDLAGHDFEADYAALAGFLAKSAFPIHPMMGNHDDRDAMRRHFDVPKSNLPDFVQYTLETQNGAVIYLDTHKIGSHAGEFCDPRLVWLDHILDQTRDTPTYIFMHHPPLALNLPAQDAIMLQDADAFLDVIARYGNVKQLFTGHVHRATSGTVQGIPFATLGSLTFQAPPPRPEWDWDTFKAAKEAPQYGVIHIENGNVILQYTQFCEYSVGMDA